MVVMFSDLVVVVSGMVVCSLVVVCSVGDRLVFLLLNS